MRPSTPTPKRLKAAKNGQRSGARVDGVAALKAAQTSKDGAPVEATAAGTSRSGSHYAVGMFSAGEARSDRWQTLAHAGQALAAKAAAGSSSERIVSEVEDLLEPL